MCPLVYNQKQKSWKESVMFKVSPNRFPFLNGSLCGNILWHEMDLLGSDIGEANVD